ncbi:MAG TPA: putative baseplate assembly protein [Gemmatimonadaceae bacterium]|nr:putative baseplate assembly protein [Gemmatimonadaceae bacterium]
MIYRCCSEKRRDAVADHPTLNGIDYLEVVDRDAPSGSPRQRTLLVRLLKDVPGTLQATNVEIRGGDRDSPVDVLWVSTAADPPGSPDTSAPERGYLRALPDADQVLVVRTGTYGDFSPYRLRLVRAADNPSPPANFDPRMAEVEFTFKAECPSDFDCDRRDHCAIAPESDPEIDYLAKDYGSFRRLLIDRLTQLIPGWQERSAADFGVVLAELLAYAGDHLSYQQDAVATEAYLETARSRHSLRRHALLVDYRMHEGCNARAWVRLTVSADTTMSRATTFYTRLTGFGGRIVPDSADNDRARSLAPQVFQPLHDADLFAGQNTISLYTWGDQECCLPAGATRATLAGQVPGLQANSVLIFAEVRGPQSGHMDDADRAHRQAVRLTSARPGVDPLDNAPITEIEWHVDDALTFPLCISAMIEHNGTFEYVEDISLAYGNVVLVDHGATIVEELGPVPKPTRLWASHEDGCACEESTPDAVSVRFRPRLKEGPLTYGGTTYIYEGAGEARVRKRAWFDPEASAASALAWDMRDVIPCIELAEQVAAPILWMPQPDLLSSASTATDFVVETEHDGIATLRFGDGILGKRPDDGLKFSATYRVGNGLAGNVGAEAIAHVVTANALIYECVNPMAASGGMPPETPAEVRRRAPRAFRRQERAVTPADYEEMAQRMSGIQRTAATLRWTGSWHTMFVTADVTGGGAVTEVFENRLRDHLERYRLAGQDLEVDGPQYVSLEVDVQVCVSPERFRADVRAALLEIFQTGKRADGRLGFLHPDNFTFGQTVYLSAFYAAAREVPGIESLEVTKFQRQGANTNQYRAAGRMTFGRLEIPRLDNDPNHADRGVLRLVLFGGK